MKFKKKNPKKYEGIRKNTYFFFLIVIVLFSLDHFFKFFVKKTYCFSIFCLKQAINTGAAFSLFEGFLWTRILLIIVALIVLVLTILFYFKTITRNNFEIKYKKEKNKTQLLLLALPFLFGGTISNMLDRVFLGYVIDYINIAHLSFLTFNIADLANIFGVVLLIIYLCKK